MNVIKINGAALPVEPFSYKITKSDLYAESTGRTTETGKMLLYPIRYGVYSISLEYHGKDSEIAQIESIISRGTMDVTFFDNGEFVTKQMYSSDRENTVEKIMNGKGRHILTFQLIEL